MSSVLLDCSLCVFTLCATCFVPGGWFWWSPRAGGRLGIVLGWSGAGGGGVGRSRTTTARPPWTSASTRATRSEIFSGMAWASWAGTALALHGW
eukprot:14180695-Alexandrium_andersonii.AAC.1